MNRRLLLLMFCLAGNALLATALLRQSSNFSRPAAVSPVVKIPAPTNQIVAIQKPVATETAAPEDFQWSQFTAPDFGLYIMELRGFGTPEQKIRDIIFGAVEAIYRPKRGALRPPKKADNGKFWEHRFFYNSQSQMTKTQREQMRALQKEEADLLKSVLGDDVYQQMAKDSGAATDWQERLYGYIPKELREKVQDIDARMNDEKQDIYAEANGYIDQYTQADLHKIEKKYHDQLAAILTPDQLLQWDLRHSDTANQLKNDLSAFDPNEDEFQAIFKYKQAAEELNPLRDPDDDSPMPVSAADRQAQTDKQAALDADLAQSIGTNRVAEYKLEQDYSYRNLIDSGVPKDSVFKLDEMKNEAQAAAQKIRDDKTLGADDRAAALSAIRTETQNSINDLLGPKPAKSYSNNGGWWLNNIAPAVK
ncbi:MAG TPA: hypothetical protein VII71_03100 [Verrucomicrobiae bacterium]